MNLRMTHFEERVQFGQRAPRCRPETQAGKRFQPVQNHSESSLDPEASKHREARRLFGTRWSRCRIVPPGMVRGEGSGQSLWNGASINPALDLRPS